MGFRSSLTFTFLFGFVCFYLYILLHTFHVDIIIFIKFQAFVLFYILVFHFICHHFYSCCPFLLVSKNLKRFRHTKLSDTCSLWLNLQAPPLISKPHSKPPPPSSQLLPTLEVHKKCLKNQICHDPLLLIMIIMVLGRDAVTRQRSKEVREVRFLRHCAFTERRFLHLLLFFFLLFPPNGFHTPSPARHYRASRWGHPQKPPSPASHHTHSPPSPHPHPRQSLWILSGGGTCRHTPYRL